MAQNNASRARGKVVAGALTALLAASSLAAQQGTDALDLSLDSLLALPTSTASRYAQTVRQSSASITIVTGDEIRAYGYRTVADVLQRVRGFYLTDDGSYVSAGVRGISPPSSYNDRLLVLIDGVPDREHVGGSASIGSDLPIPMQLVERIEIVRGPNSSAYGASAVLAVVNIILKQLQDGEAVVAGESGDAGHYGGTFGVSKHYGQSTLQVLGRLASGNGKDVYYPEFDDPETNNGIAEALDWHDAIGLLARWTRGGLTVSGQYRNRNKGIPTGWWEADFNSTANRATDRQIGVHASFDRELGTHYGLNVRASFESYDNEVSYPYDGFDSWDSFTGRWGTIEARLLWDPSSRIRFSAGAEAQRHFTARYRLWDDEEDYFNGDFPFWALGLTAQTELQATRWMTINLGTRGDRYGSYGAVSPRAAIVLHPEGGTTVKLLHNAGFRAPSIYERFFEDEFTDFKANPDVTPERVSSQEIVLEQQLAPWLLGSVSAFRSDLADFIHVAEDHHDGLYEYTNHGSVFGHGFEAELVAKPGTGLSSYLSYGYARAKAHGKSIVNYPAHSVKAGITSPVTTYATLAFEGRYESGRKTVHNTRTDAYFLANTNLRMGPRSGGWSASLSVHNVFDVSYGVPGGIEHLQNALPQSGRSLVFRIDYGF